MKSVTNIIFLPSLLLLVGKMVLNGGLNYYIMRPVLPWKFIEIFDSRLVASLLTKQADKSNYSSVLA